MPLRRKVPSLQDLALDNIAQNVEFHSRNFQKTKHNDENIFLYYTFQRLFGEVFFKKIYHAVFCGTVTDTSKLDFVLGRHLTKVKLHCSRCPVTKISEEITSHVFFRCKEAKEVDLHYSYLNEGHFLDAVRNWKNIVKLDLSLTECTDGMICSVWDNLCDLEELRLYQSTKISDKCLQYLCKRHSPNETFHFCEERGFCCKLGKKLKVLNVNQTQVTVAGIKYALLHLHSLQHLDSSTPWYNHSLLSQAVLDLASDFNSRDCDFISLKIKSLNCRTELSTEELRKLASACPCLEELGLIFTTETLEELTRNTNVLINSFNMIVRDVAVLYSPEFRIFLLKHSSYLRKLSITTRTYTTRTYTLNMRPVIDIFNICENMREFVIKDTFLYLDGNSDTCKTTRPIEKLQVLDVSSRMFLHKSVDIVFTQLLARMTNLKILKIPILSIQRLIRKNFGNRLCSLKTLYIHDTDMSEVSMLDILNNGSSLREIILRNCGHTDRFLKTHRDIVRKSNLLLKFECQAVQRVRGLGSTYDHWYSRLEGTSDDVDLGLIWLYL